jgi:hypothetical protein
MTDPSQAGQERQRWPRADLLGVNTPGIVARSLRGPRAAAHDRLAREHKSLTSEAALPELPDPSLAWEDLSAADRRALTEMLVDKIIIERHPSKIDEDGRRHYLIRAIPYQDPHQEAERLKAVHEARVKIVPRV